MELEVVGDVEDIDEEEFLELAEAAKNGCPVSQALEGNVEITLSAKLG
jgi:osmotically inducible protein OsmC